VRLTCGHEHHDISRNVSLKVQKLVYKNKKVITHHHLLLRKKQDIARPSPSVRKSHRHNPLSLHIPRLCTAVYPSNTAVLAGSKYAARGNIDASWGTDARFRGPTGLAVDSSTGTEYLYVADAGGWYLSVAPECIYCHQSTCTVPENMCVADAGECCATTSTALSCHGAHFCQHTVSAGEREKQTHFCFERDARLRSHTHLYI
jgi:hypothetical protein